jgi:tRNA threonylcarbamoyladenosine biosynthesis protein TsaE
LRGEGVAKRITENTEEQREHRDFVEERIWMKERRFRTRSVEGTLELGERIAEMLTAGLQQQQHGLVVILRGEVGAGKTTLVKGIAAALGAAAEDEVTSPTFTIVHEYVGTSVRLFHLDLYRLETEEQIAVLGLEEMAGYENALVLVEWGERFESVVKMAGGEIYMEHGEGDERGLIVRLKD